MDELIYEVRDTSDDTMYYPLGIFLSLEDAKTAIEKFESAKTKISEFSEEYEEITVIERKIGWSGSGRDVLVIRREDYYDEDRDKYLWRRIAE